MTLFYSIIGLVCERALSRTVIAKWRRQQDNIELKSHPPTVWIIRLQARFCTKVPAVCFLSSKDRSTHGHWHEWTLELTLVCLGMIMMCSMLKIISLFCSIWDVFCSYGTAALSGYHYIIDWYKTLDLHLVRHCRIAAYYCCALFKKKKPFWLWHIRSTITNMADHRPTSRVERSPLIKEGVHAMPPKGQSQAPPQVWMGTPVVGPGPGPDEPYSEP